MCNLAARDGWCSVWVWAFACGRVAQKPWDREVGHRWSLLLEPYWLFLQFGGFLWVSL